MGRRDDSKRIPKDQSCDAEELYRPVVYLEGGSGQGST